MCAHGRKSTKFRTFVIAAAGIALLAGPALAQAPAAPQANPLDVIPDKLPFNTPYGLPITLAQAEQLIAAVEAEAKKRDWAFNISVVDTNGDLVAFKRPIRSLRRRGRAKIGALTSRAPLLSSG